MFKDFLDNSITRKVVFFVGTAIMLLAGLYFAITSDLLLMNSSLWLFISIICAFGSGICMAISDLVKSNKVAFYIVRSLGVVLAILFIVVVLIYPKSYSSVRKSDKEVRDIYTTLKEDKSYTTEAINKYILVTQIPSIIFAAIGVIVHAFGIVEIIICGIDE